MPIAQNFRRDLAGKVYQLSQYALLNPVADKTFDPVKLNERFLKMHEAVATCFDAIADVASRDSTFLPAFFQGFVNPVYVKGQAYPDKLKYKFINGFNSNGTAKTFAEERIVYSYSDLGDVTTQDYELLLFKNGDLMPFADYDIDNSAYGVKAYVKSSKVANNDRITLAVHRVYNREYSYWRRTFTAAASSLDQIVDVSEFKNFFDPRYIKLVLKRAGKVHFRPINPANYYVVADSANGKIRIVCTGISFAKDDVLMAVDATSYWETETSGTVDSSGVIPSVPLSQEIPATVGTESVAVGFLSHRDFDVWLNGRHLVPGKHFTVSAGLEESDDSPWRLNFLIQTPANKTYNIVVKKNIPVLFDEATYVVKDEVDEKGIEYLPENKFPVLEGIGEMYVNGRFVETNNLVSAHDEVMLVNGIDERQEMFFKLNAPANASTDSILEEHHARNTELDKITALIGGVGELVERLKIQRGTVPLSTRSNIVVTLSGTLIDPVAVVSFDMATYVVRSNAENAGTLTVFDCNSSMPAELWELYSITTDPIIDCNVFTYRDVVVNCN